MLLSIFLVLSGAYFAEAQTSAVGEGKLTVLPPEAVAGGPGLAGAGAGAGARARVAPAKEPLLVPPGEKLRLLVKFRDGLKARASAAGELLVRATEEQEIAPLVAVVRGGRMIFHPTATVTDEKIEALRQRAAARTGVEAPDLAGLLEVKLDAAAGRADVIALAEKFHALPEVEYVELESIDQPPPPPSVDIEPPSGLLVSYQTYRTASGINADAVWAQFGVRGNGVRVTDCEYQFNPNHEDMAGRVTLQTGIASMYSGYGADHGTAALGQMAALENAYGMTGLAPEATYYFYPESSTRTDGTTQSRAATVLAAIADSGVGDVVVLEMQDGGPAGGSKFVPAEYDLSVWNAVKTGSDAGVIVVAAAGNGGENMDTAPFAAYHARGDSGAIIVGAGDADRARLAFSTYGERVNLQGWGTGVATLGYGNLQSYGGDDNQTYTDTFSGTSSATPIVAGAVVLLQSMARESLARSLTPLEMRQLLIDTGRSQTGNASESIGPLPDLAAALLQIAPQAPEIVVEEPVGNVLVTGEALRAFGNSNIGVPVAKTFTIRNAGRENLTSLAVTLSGENSAEFALGALGVTTLAPQESTTFTVTFTPTAAGSRDAALQIISNDADENPFDIQLTGTGVVPLAPEIVVVDPFGSSLEDGLASLYYGSELVGTSVSKTITVRNTGTANLTGLAVARSGTHAADFTLGNLGATTLAPGTSTTFTVTFTPTAEGSRSAVLQIASNDKDENPFDIELDGSGFVPLAPEIAVEHVAGTALVDGFAMLYYGSVRTGTSVSKTVTVRNIGTADLTSLAVTHSGRHAADFVLGNLGTATLAPGRSTTFTVTFTPLAVGSRDAALKITSNDADESPFEMTLSGIGIDDPVPEIVVEHPRGTSLTDNLSLINYGRARIGASESKTITVRNTGIVNLTKLAVTRSGRHVTDFALGKLGATTLPPGASTTFTVTFSPLAAGSREASLKITSNDADENPFDIVLMGAGILSSIPEIVVQNPLGTNLTANKSSRSFGRVAVGKTSKVMVFTIKNDGSSTLENVTVSLKGKQAKDFIVVKSPAKSVARGKSTQFKVIYKPGMVKASKATLLITSNDKNENPFRVQLTGRGMK